MLDPVSISVAVCAIIVAILTHIKSSKCFGMELEARTPLLESKQNPFFKDQPKNNKIENKTSSPIPIQTPPPILTTI